MNHRGVSGLGKYICPVCQKASFNFYIALNGHVSKCRQNSIQNRVQHLQIDNGDEDYEDTFEIINSKYSTSSGNKSHSSFSKNSQTSIHSGNKLLSTIHTDSSTVVDKDSFDGDDDNGVDQNDINMDLSHVNESNNCSTTDVLYFHKYSQWQTKIGHIIYGQVSSTQQNIDSHGVITHKDLPELLDGNKVSGLHQLLNVGWVNSTDGKSKGIPLSTDLLEIFSFVKLHYLSDKSGDNLLLLIKEFVDRHPTIENVFIYKKMKSINSAVSRALSSLYDSFEININFPEQLLGKDNNEKLKVKRALDQRNNNTSGQYIIAKGYGLNIIQLVSEYLITTDLKDIHTKPQIEYDSEGNRIIGSFASADFYSHVFEETQQVYGEDVIPICLGLSYDATDIGGGGGSAIKSATPFNIRVLNVSDDVFPLQASTILGGFAPNLTIPPAILLQAISATVQTKTKKDSVMTYIKMKMTHLYVEQMCEEVLDIQQNGPIELFIGKLDNEYKKVKVVFVICLIVLDNQEAFKGQGLSFGAQCPCNCRMCLIKTKKFYSYSTFKEMAANLMEDYDEMDNVQKLDEYIDLMATKTILRDTITTMDMAKKGERIWWKWINFNSSNNHIGYKKQPKIQHDQDVLENLKKMNVKPIDNVIINKVLQPFFSRYGIKKHDPIIMADLCFGIDYMHTGMKGFIEYNLKYCILIQIQHMRLFPTIFGSTMPKLDQRIIRFDIYQPLSAWGNIPQRRLPGISGTFTYETTKKGKKMETATISGGMLEASRMIEYLYQMTFSWNRNSDYIVPNKLITYTYNDGNRHIIKMQYNPMQLFFDASNCTMALNHMLSRKRFTESELQDLERLLLLVQILVHRLFILKQLLANSITGNFVLKLHLMMHFVIMIKLFGHLGITNTDKTESAHVEVKENYSNSSHKHSTVMNEMLLMNRTHQLNNYIKKLTTNNITSSNNDLSTGTCNIDIHNSNLENNSSMDIEYVEENTNFWGFNPTLGYYNFLWIKLTNTPTFLLRSNNNIVPSLEIIPIHPIIGLEGMKKVFLSNLNDPNKSRIEKWEQIGNQCLVGTATFQLLKGIRLYTVENNIKSSYIIYSKRDHTIQSALGMNNSKITQDRFNFVEVRSEDGNGNSRYDPFHVFGIIRMFNKESNDEQILIIGAYMKKVKLDKRQLKQLPYNNLYNYWYQYGNLWLDLLTINRIHGPLIGIYDSDCEYPPIHSIQGAKNQRYIIQRPFFRDSSQVPQRTKIEFNEMLYNLFENIKVPEGNELELFDIFINKRSGVGNSNDILQDVNEIDHEEH